MKKRRKLFLATIGLSLSIFSLVNCGTFQKHVYVEGITFKTDSYTMEVGSQFQLEYDFKPVNSSNKNVRYELYKYTT